VDKRKRKVVRNNYVTETVLKQEKLPLIWHFWRSSAQIRSSDLSNNSLFVYGPLCRRNFGQMVPLLLRGGIWGGGGGRGVTTEINEHQWPNLGLGWSKLYPPDKWRRETDSNKLNAIFYPPHHSPIRRLETGSNMYLLRRQNTVHSCPISHTF
jgi:hypothetical protein